MLREIENNSVNGVYDSKKSQQKAYEKRHNARFQGKSIIANDKLRDFVKKHLLEGCSPESISGRIRKRENEISNIGKDTIYRFLRSPYGKIIGLKLEKKKRHFRRSRKVELDGRVFIENRPKIANNRGRVGDLEADFIVSGKSGKGVLLTVVDRKTRKAFLEIIYNVCIDEVHSAFKRRKKKFPEMKTLTLDNDILFRMRKTLEKLLKVKIYFCRPYHSWEKGEIANLNRFIRIYIPKGSNISKYDKKDIRLIERKCNGRFLKCLDYATPDEALEECRLRKNNKKTAVKPLENEKS
ncbi:MAG: IS30 family transposase [bacterium]